MDERLKGILAGIPESCGVYTFKDKAGAILYIGKAVSLKKRVQSYFTRRLDSKTQALVVKIADIEYRLCHSESQALICESALVKEHVPPYNISLKDDKSFPLVRISQDEFPVVSVCRRKKKSPDDHSRYLGPYTDSASLRQVLKIVRRIFGFRSCSTLPKKACLFGRINLCPAPCEGRITKAEYQTLIEEIKLFMEYKYEPLIALLNRQMNDLARDKRYEAAAAIRDQIVSLRSIGDDKDPAAYFDELRDLKKFVGLSRLPERIEAFDISNISGAQASGSMVSFYRGVADKNNYRRFRIKTVSGIDDYKMLAEVVRRRYQRLIMEGRKMPDLVLIDGGRAHLSVADREIKQLGVKLKVISIAKDRENIYVQGRQDPLNFSGDTPALNLIRRIRDEAHRFALAYHHLLRQKTLFV